MKTLILDANNLSMRSIHAMARSGLSADGVATGPLLAFINSLSRLVRDEKPTHLVACWDSGVSEFRLAIDPDYKAHRTQPDSDFDRLKRTAFSIIKEWCAVTGIFQVERPGFEADDLIAKYATEERFHQQREVVILSSDKDFLQILCPGIEQIRFSSANTPTDRWDVLRVQGEFGVTRRDFTHCLALAGDVSDGVPGLPRFGMKTAAKVLKKHDLDIERVLSEHPVAREHRDRFEKNLALVDLRNPRTDLILPPLPAWQPTNPSSALYADLVSFLIRYRLDSVKTRLYDGTLWNA